MANGQARLAPVEDYHQFPASAPMITSGVDFTPRRHDLRG
jgi:hypothetical protein